MKKIKVLFSFLILLLALYGCGGSSNSVSTKESSYDDYEYDNTYNKSNSVGSTDSLDLSDEQMYSYKASARVQSLNYDESYNKLKEKSNHMAEYFRVRLVQIHRQTGTGVRLSRLELEKLRLLLRCLLTNMKISSTRLVILEES